MRKLLGVTLGVLVLSFALAAQAAVTVKYTGMQYKQTVTIKRAGHGAESVYAGVMNLKVNGDYYPGFCVDLDHHIYNNQTYQANITVPEVESPWCEIAFLLANYGDPGSNFEAAVLQTAIWKVLYASQNMYVTQSAVNNAANSLVAEAQGTCPLSCQGDVSLTIDAWAEYGGEIFATATLLEDGLPAVGQWIEMTGGGGYADENGQVQVLLPADELPITIEAGASGQWMAVLDPIGNVQALTSFMLLDPCFYDATATIEPTPLGDPRTIGFWKHQAKVALGAKGKAHVDAATLQSWLPLEVFGLTIASLDDLYDALWLKKAPMWKRAQQQCTATLLNVAYGELGWYTPFDTDGDGADDAYFWQIFDDAQDAFDAGDFEYAKTLCDDINNL